MTPLRTPLRPLVAALLAATLLQTMQPALAATKNWNCQNDSWTSAACWSPAGLPADGDDVYVSLVGGASTTLSYPASAGVRSIDLLQVATNGTAPLLLQQTGGELDLGYVNLAPFGTGQMLLSGGIQRMGTLVLGSQANGSGTYKLEGGQLFSSTTFVGAFGGGSFTQTGGLMDGRVLYIGQTSVQSSPTAYVMSGGELVNSLEIRIGRQNGRGSFSQSAGSVQAAMLNVGFDGIGSYSATGTALISAERLSVGSASGGNGSFSQSGGNTRVTAGQLVIGQGGAALYTLSSGTLTSSDATVYTRLQHNGGTHLGSSIGINGRVGGERASYVLQAGALAAAALNIGGSAGPGGDFNHNAGSVAMRGTLAVAANGRYVMSGSALLDASAGGIDNAGSFEQIGGSIAGTLINRGSFVYGQADKAAPGFSGLMINQGSVLLNVDATFGNGLRNQGVWPALAGGHTLTLNGSGLDNQGSMNLTGGTLLSNGPIGNSGSVTGWGRVEGSGVLLNPGNWSQAGGDLTLANGKTNVNQGSWGGQSGRRLVLEGSGTQLLNQGSLALNGGIVSGAGSLQNMAAGVISGGGSIGSSFSNQGTVALGAGEHLSLPAGSTSGGLIDLRGASALLSGSGLANSGLIAGQGRVATPVANSGRIQAEGGVLVLAGALTGNGVLAAASGATLLVQQMPAGSGMTLQLDGGTLDLPGQTLSNAVLLSGHGTLRAGSIVNGARMLFSAGSSQVFGPLLNRSGSQLVVSGGGDATFLDTVEARSGSELRVSVDSRAIFFGRVTQQAGAAFTGSGTSYFEGGLTSGGAPAVLGAEGDVVLGATNVLQADIGAAGNDRWAIGGALQFGGTLQLTLEPGTPAVAGMRYDLFDWGAISGSFAALDLGGAPLPAGLIWDTSRLYVDGSIGVSAVPEPGQWALMLCGLLVVAQRARTLRAASLTSSGPR